MNREPLITTFLEINTHVNLSAIRDADGVRVKHIMDSLELIKIFPLKPNIRVCDVGTGGGFPLLPLAMTHPNTHFVGIDSTKKKVEAVHSIIQKLSIKNAQAIWTRSENYKEVFDVVTARAVGYIDKILKWSYHLLKKGGYFVFYKQMSSEEKKDILKLCNEYGLQIIHEHIYQLFPDDIQRVLYVLQKR